MHIMNSMSRIGSVGVIGLLLVACSSETVNFGDGSADGGDAGGAAGAEPDGGADAADTGDVDAAPDAPCTSVQHFNGYSFFPDCHKIGDYDEALALVACGVYMGVNCEVLTSLNLCNGTNLVGHKSEAWIVWTWTATTGTTRLSWPTPPECPTTSDPVWW
jgi:hypothetical protein